MAFRLRDTEATTPGLRRLARERIDRSLALLQPGRDPAAGVHDVRKSLKRLRALVRVARDELGEGVYREENAALRETGRRLSGTRDAEVLRATLRGVVERHRDELGDRAFGDFAATLDRDAERAHAALVDDPRRVEETRAALTATRVRLDDWPLDEDLPREALAPGLRRIYKRGRRVQRRARRQPTTENLHELRKRTKDTWHAAQILRCADPKRMKRLARRAHELADLLGDDHDLAVLAQAAREDRSDLSDAERDLLTGLIERERAELQAEALDGARTVYRRKPRKLARSS